MVDITLFITYNYPTQHDFIKTLDLLDFYGITCVEIGIPSSNAYLDGEVIQNINNEVLQKGINKKQLHTDLKNIYTKYNFKKVIMGYLDSFENYDINEVLDYCDGIICVNDQDYPKSIPLINEEMDIEEIKSKVNNTNLFTYVISGIGKTGSFKSVPTGYIETIKKIKKIINTTCYVGFGIKTKQDICEVLNNGADGVIIGSYFMTLLKQEKELINYLEEISNIK